MFEAGGPADGVRRGGARDQVDHRPPSRGAARLPRVRQRRLRHGGGDRQRSVLRRGAAAGGQRVFRDRIVRVVRRTRAGTPGSAQQAGARRAWTPALPGEGGSRRRCRGWSLRDDIELAGSAVGVCVHRGRAADLRRATWCPATRSCSWPRAACTPTAPRWPGRVAVELPDGYRTLAAERAGVRRGAARPERAVRRARRGLLVGGAVEVHYLSHITGHGLLEADASASRADVPVRWLPEVPEVAHVPGRAGWR